MSHYQFAIHSATTAPEPGDDLLNTIKSRIGFVPNIYGLLAASPAALEGLCRLNSAFEASAFSPLEQEIVALTTSVENGCDYCIAGHSRFAIDSGLPATDVSAIRNDQSLSDPKLDALFGLTRSLIKRRGEPDDDALSRFEQAGFRTEQVFDVLLGIAAKVITNYASKFSRLPIDKQFLAPSFASSRTARQFTIDNQE